MPKIKFISLILTLLASSALWAQGDKLNFFIFVADDQYIDSLGCYSEGKSQSTPNIERFAEQALKFQRAFTPSAMCAPSRGALYSGLYPLRNGLHANHWKYFKTTKTLPDYFNELGYESILWGKNHVSSKGKKHYKWSKRINNSQKIPGDYTKHRTFADHEVKEFLGKVTKPFVMVYGSHLPHAPFIKDGYKGFERYEASNRFTDEEFGRFLKIFEEMKLTENTVIIYLSDHGANIPWAKWTNYNRGVHIPVLIKWPGMKMEQESSALISMVDFLPTLLTAAGKEDLSNFDGKSFLEVIKKNKEAHHEQVYFTHTCMNVNEVYEPYPIRAVTDGRYKLIQNLNAKIKHPKAKTFYTGVSTEWELYDLRKDKAEQLNLIGNPENKLIFEALKEKLSSWRKAQKDGGLETEALMSPRANPEKAKKK